MEIVIVEYNYIIFKSTQITLLAFNLIKERCYNIILKIN